MYVSYATLEFSTQKVLQTDIVISSICPTRAKATHCIHQMKLKAVLRVCVLKINNTRGNHVTFPALCEHLALRWPGGHPLIVDDTRTQAFCAQLREKELPDKNIMSS